MIIEYFSLVFFFSPSVLESDDPERLRVVIQETISRLTGDTTLNENTVILIHLSSKSYCID